MLEAAQHIAGDTQMERADVGQRTMTTGRNPQQVFLAVRTDRPVVPGKAAPPWKSDGVALITGVYSTPKAAAARA